jgi:DNA-3-methyladenine glycosylase
MQSMRLPNLSKSALQCAPQLLGCYLERTVDGQKIVGKIVETEAYDQTDAASHSYKGKTPRTEIMFGPAGFLYVYFTYGMHYCCNIVTGQVREGSAVLIRALEPIEGAELMKFNRQREHDLSNGPAKLCQALAINKDLNGHDLQKPPLRLLPGEPIGPKNIVTATRIGISQDTHRLWRFYIRGNRHVSTL